MTREEFARFHKTGRYSFKGLSVSLTKEQEEEYAVAENQACSVEELMRRQASGLPLPNLTPTIHTAYNGLNIEDMTIANKKSADMIDVQMSIRDLKKDIQDTEYAYEPLVKSAQKKSQKKKPSVKDGE